MSLERVIIYLEAYAYDVCAWHRQVIALWVANEAISAGESSGDEMATVSRFRDKSGNHGRRPWRS